MLAGNDAVSGRRMTRFRFGGERMTNTMAHRQRREFLRLALGGALAASLARSAPLPPPPSRLAQPVPFAADTVVRKAVELAAKPFKEPEAPLPSLFSGLTFDQYASIRRVPGTAIWSGEKLGFSLEPLHRGFVYTTPIAINIVENGFSQKVIYESADFDFGKLQPPAALGDLGFSGLRILKSSDQGFEDAAIFQGASFYRARARGQDFGVTARGLAIRTGDEPGEEFPLFREFWVEKPNPAANTLTIYALLDSASVTGAFRFTLRPLETTIIDTEMTLIARVAIDKLGFGAMAAAYLFSGLDHRRADDVRAAVYESTGLQILSGSGEWLWRPVSNRETLQISAFSDLNPRGFGLLQRTRSFDAFYDDERMGTEAHALDRADRRLGRGRPAPARDPGRLRDQRQHRRAMAPEGRNGRRHEPVARLPAVLVLVAALESPARDLRVVAKRQDRQSPALHGRDGRRPIRRPAEGRGGNRRRSRQSRQDRLGSAVPIQGQAFGPRRFRSRPWIGALFRASADAQRGQSAGQRDMALSMDSLTLAPREAPPGDIGSSLGSSMPGFAPLAMPAQSFRRFSRRDRRAWPRRASPGRRSSPVWRFSAARSP